MGVGREGGIMEENALGGEGEARSHWHQFSRDEPLRDGLEQPSELSLQRDKEMGFYPPTPITFG